MEGVILVLFLVYLIFSQKYVNLIKKGRKSQHYPRTQYYIILQVNENLFPCKLSNENTKLAEEAVDLAVKSWGQRSLSELEAEERLSYSCEKVNLL